MRPHRPEPSYSSSGAVFRGSPEGDERGGSALNNYVTLARPSYWVKNALILPGVIAAVMFGLGPVSYGRLLVAFAATCLVASANYVINGWFDAVSDAHHPLKSRRPAVLGSVSVVGIALEYTAFSLSGLALGWCSSQIVFGLLVFMLLMGVSYNVPPLRLKDRPYLDVLSESVNDAIRLLVGWYVVDAAFLPPSSLILGYWMGGAFLVTVKRLAEFRMFADQEMAANYRLSFAHYTTTTLTVSAQILGMASSFFLGVFLIRHRVEYLLAMPAIWALFGWYLALGFKEDSAAQRPESLWREPALPLLTALVVGLLLLFTFVDVPALEWLNNSKLIAIDVLRLNR